MIDRIVIVGAGAAGLATGDALRDRGFTGEIVLLGAETHPPYDRPPLSKQLLHDGGDFDFVRLASAEYCAERDIDFRPGTVVTGLDRTAKRIVTADGQSIEYGTVVVATGVEARRLAQAEGIPGVVTLRSIEDALTLREELRPGRRLVIVGAGFIGLEVAATAIKKGCVVDVVEPAPGVLVGKFPQELARRIEGAHLVKGVRFHFGTVVEDWNRSDGRIASLTLSDGRTLAADAVLVGIGTVPAVGWLADSGLTLENGVVCDERGRASDDVYAVGDVANWHHPLLDANLRVEHRLSAGEQASVVAADITGTEPAILDLPFFWTDQYEDKWQAYGYIHGDSEVEIVLNDADANRMVALLRRDGRLEAVVGKNAVKQLIPYRRQLKASAAEQTINL